MNFKRGFTLIEILISTVIIFLLFSLVYMTFFSVSNLTATLQDNMKSTEILLKFINKFYEESKGFIIEEDADFDIQQKEITFKYITGKMRYPSQVTYLVESSDTGESLIRQQKNILTDYLFTMPILKDYESINFMFYDGEIWDYNILDKEKICAIALEIEYEGEKVFCPVKLTINGKDGLEK